MVLDLHLPGDVDGADVFRTIGRELDGRPAAVVLSAAPAAAGVAKALGLPLVGKPFELERLIAVMRRALEAT